MRLRDKMRPSIPPMEPGVYFAVCSIVADLGTQYSEKFKSSAPKVLIAFDIPSETAEVDGEQKPRQLSSRYTYSVDKKSNLYKLLVGWLGITDEDKLADIELFELIGRGCQVQVTLDKDGGRNQISTVMGMPRGMEAPKTSNPLITYDIAEDGFEGARWEALPEWLQKIVMQSEEYVKAAPDKPLDMPDTEGAAEAPAPVDAGRRPSF